MIKIGKFILDIIAIIVVYPIIIFCSMIPSDVATYNSPDEDYVLEFKQVGSPWLYSPTNVKLTLKNKNGKIIKSVYTTLYNDGLNANEENIVSVSWNDDAVVVILRASEMDDKEISISYEQEFIKIQVVDQRNLLYDPLLKRNCF